MYKPVIVRRGSGGWGGPLTLVPTEEKHKIVSITGGGIHPLAVKIADMCGGEAVDRKEKYWLLSSIAAARRGVVSIPAKTL